MSENLQYDDEVVKIIETPKKRSKKRLIAFGAVSVICAGIAGLVGGSGLAVWDNVTGFVSSVAPKIKKEVNLNDPNRPDATIDKVTSVEVKNVKFCAGKIVSEEGYPITVTKTPSIATVDLDILADERYIDYSAQFESELCMNPKTLAGSFNETQGVATFNLPANITDAFGVETNVVPSSRKVDARGNLINSVNAANFAVVSALVGQIMGNPANMPGVTSKIDNTIANTAELGALKNAGNCAAKVAVDNPIITDAIGGKMAETIKSIMEVGGADIKNVILTYDGKTFAESNPEFIGSNPTSSSPRPADSASKKQSVFTTIPLLNSPDKKLAEVMKNYKVNDYTVKSPDEKPDGDKDKITASSKCEVSQEVIDQVNKLKGR